MKRRTQSPRCYPPASFAAKPREGLFVDAAKVKAAIGRGDIVTVNALGPQFHRGLEPSRYGRPGRVPGSVNVPAATLVDPATKGFTTLADAAAKFAAQGVSKDKRAICYCGGGISATIDLFLLHQLGHDDITLYDDSGQLLYRSPPFTYKAGRYAPAWFSRIVEPPMQPVEIRLIGGRIVLRADPSRSALDGWDELVRMLQLACAGLVVVVGLAMELSSRA